MEETMNAIETNDVQRSKKHVNVLAIVLSAVTAILLIATIALAVNVIDYNSYKDQTFLFDEWDRDAYGNYRILYDPDMNKAEFYELATSEDYDIIIFTEDQANIDGVDVFDLKALYKLIMIEYDNYAAYHDASIEKIGAVDSDGERSGCHYMIGASIGLNESEVPSDFQCQIDVVMDSDKVAAGMQEVYTKMQVCAFWHKHLADTKDFFGSIHYGE